VRGLTQAERVELLEAAIPPTPDQHTKPGVENDSQAAVLAQLHICGRVCVMDWETEEYFGTGWFATELGRLALRVCPVGEP